MHLFVFWASFFPYFIIFFLDPSNFFENEYNWKVETNKTKAKVSIIVINELHQNLRRKNKDGELVTESY